MINKISFILPTYNETDSVYQLILDIRRVAPNNSSIVVIDDTPDNRTVESVEAAFKKGGWDPTNTKIIRNPKKSGRGHAVKMGLQYAILDESIDCFVEMDSDGSHSAIMALRVAEKVPKFDFCVGSRYLPGSKILGWGLQRRIFSRVINQILKSIFNNEISDWTNGLRAYSRHATATVCSHKSLTNGFIYLSEQAVILTNRTFQITQVPITFQNRTHGKSTVTWKEIASSISGVFRILKNKKHLRGQ